MQIIYLISVILGISGQNILKKCFSEKTRGNGVYTFSMLSCLFSAAFFILTASDFRRNTELIPYACFFAIPYGTAIVSTVLALRWGPLSLTALISSFSLMIPTFYGLIFLKDPVGFGLYPGLVLLGAALFLINKKGNETKGVSLKWLICVLLAFLGNGLCSVAQTMQQKRFCGQFKNEFMIIALIITAVIALTMALIKEHSLIKKQTVVTSALGVLCGGFNGAVNLMVMILSGRMQVSLMFPIISAGGIVVTYVISKVFYKEKLSRLQLVGFILGTVSVVLLNI